MRADDGWAIRSGDDLLGGLAVDGFAPIGRGGSIDFDDPSVLTRGAAESAQEPARASGRPAAARPAGRSERMIGLHLIDLVDDAGYLRERPRGGGDAPGLPARARSRRCSPGCSCSIRPACSRARSRNAWRCSCASATGSIRRWRRCSTISTCWSQGDLPELARACGVGAEDLSRDDRGDQGARPEARPGLRSEPVRRWCPTSSCAAPPGGWRVELNTATLPRVLVNTATTASCAPTGGRQAGQGVSERAAAVGQLAGQGARPARPHDAQGRRGGGRAPAALPRSTACQHLRPLVLRDIAATTELHESTVSRATADKYVATPRGNFPFRYFFSNALPGTDGGAEPCGRGDPPADQGDDRARGPRARAVGRSDRRGAAREGVAIARRTVAKYRESLAHPVFGAAPPHQGIKACLMRAFGLILSRGQAVTRRAPKDVPDGLTRSLSVRRRAHGCWKPDSDGPGARTDIGAHVAGLARSALGRRAAPGVARSSGRAREAATGAGDSDDGRRMVEIADIISSRRRRPRSQELAAASARC